MQRLLMGRARSDAWLVYPRGDSSRKGRRRDRMRKTGGPRGRKIVPSGSASHPDHPVEMATMPRVTE